MAPDAVGSSGERVHEGHSMPLILDTLFVKCGPVDLERWSNPVLHRRFTIAQAQAMMDEDPAGREARKVRALALIRGVTEAILQRRIDKCLDRILILSAYREVLLELRESLNANTLEVPILWGDGSEKRVRRALLFSQYSVAHPVL